MYSHWTTLTKTEEGNGTKFMIMKKKRRDSSVSSADQLIEQLQRIRSEREGTKIVIICETRTTANYMAAKTSMEGIGSTVLVGGTRKKNRPNILEDFKTGKYPVIFMTPHLTLPHPPAADICIFYKV